MEFCQLQDCPAGSRCQNLDDGYECIANATFDGVSTAFTYEYGRAEERNVSNLALDSIEITYRSNTGGTLLYMAPDVGDQHFTISVNKDIITVSWQLDLENQGAVSYGKSQPDGNWTFILIKLHNNSLECSYANPTEEHTSHVAPNFNFQLWYALLENGTVTLGGLSGGLSDKHSYVTVGSRNERRNGIEGNTVDYNEHRLTTVMPPHNMISGNILI